MPRRVKNAKTDTRTARSKLERRQEPYWTVISKGSALGYRKGARGGTWIARLRDEVGKQHYEALGATDDTVLADGVTVLDYRQAHDAAVRWFTSRTREIMGDLIPHKGPFTVSDACDLYVKAYEAGRTVKGNGRNITRLMQVIEPHILPTLGTVEVVRLTRKRISDWHQKLAETPPRLRSAKGAAPRYKDLDDTPEGRRKRRSTANRVLTVLKAVLTHAVQEGKVVSDDAWRMVKPFREADAARARYLSDDEARRLVNAADLEFRPLLLAGLHTGARYSELAGLVREDFNADAGTVFIRQSKSGKPRHVVLTAEGTAFFAGLATHTAPGARLLTRADGRVWKKDDQARPMAAAVKAARIAAVTYHELRHTYASRLVMRGAPLPVVAQQLGHSDTRMVEKHYAHLAPSYVSDAVRAAMGGWDAGADVKTDNVVPLAGRAG